MTELISKHYTTKSGQYGTELSLAIDFAIAQVRLVAYRVVVSITMAKNAYLNLLQI